MADLRNLRIGDLLKSQGFIDDAQIQEALDFQKANREMRLGEILIKLGHITEEVLLNCLSSHLNLRVVDLKKFAVELDAVAVIPRVIAEKYKMLVISQTDSDIILAMDARLNYQGLEEARTFAPQHIQLVLCYQGDLEDAISVYYSELTAKSAAEGVRAVSVTEQTFDFDVGGEEAETPVVKLVNSLLMKGYSVGATDIHIEPYENEILVRLRVDGVITEYLSLEYSVLSSLVARIKIISGVDIAEKRLPQDGNFRYRMGDDSFNIRTSLIPTVYGEKVVMRFLDMKTQISNESRFGMNDVNYNKALNILRSPHGIIYIAGATGSGKTTTLYFFLDYLSKRNISIVSIEDPVEKKMKRVAQMQVNAAAGLTFHSGLRAILRQDPDVIMVGETRDEETATISVRSAITGHLVLSTIHTNNAISTITRLTDMGIPPYMVSSSLTGLISQRLVRAICPACKREYEPPDAEIEALGLRPGAAYKGVGCKECNYSGYRGRVAVHEIIEMDAKVKRMIADQRDIDDIERYCMQEKGMRLIGDEIKRLIDEGATTIAEYIRIAPTL